LECSAEFSSEELRLFPGRGDKSAPMLALCRRKAERLGLTANLHFQSMSALDLPRR
jgi:hypothetical protein